MKVIRTSLVYNTYISCYFVKVDSFVPITIRRMREVQHSSIYIVETSPPSGFIKTTHRK